MTGDPALLTLLQFADGLFPAGGFAHSFGLETYVQDGLVSGRRDLEMFVVAHLEGSAGPADAAAGAIAVRVARRNDPEEWIALDARLDAMKTVPEFRMASRQMGRQTLRIAAGVGDDPFLAELTHAVDGGRAAAHHATVFGAAVGRGGADPEGAAAAYLYATAALLVGAGLRLIKLGQLDGQRVLAAMRSRIARLAASAAAASVDDLWSFNPALEIAGIRHAALDPRLFRS
jgi:urease accessory protein